MDGALRCRICGAHPTICARWGAILTTADGPTSPSNLTPAAAQFREIVLDPFAFDDGAPAIALTPEGRTGSGQNARCAEDRHSP